MKLSKVASIKSGFHSRGKIESFENGSHFLLQARDVDGEKLTYQTDGLIRFNPDSFSSDGILRKNDVLFMARGARNYSVILLDIPDFTLAAACFFIVRVSDQKLLPAYLCWYLNQPPVESYLFRQSGRGVHMPVIRRSVLEKLDIPLPNLESQKKIVELEALRKEEEHLTMRLAEKRKQLITASCLKLIREG
ncbi:MAG: restriction endonuclease subunit S [Deltaproteobacteria bacterium]|nr:restriction endonuclease subunit S [Deltaproteobacteria bacterium]